MTNQLFTQINQHVKITTDTRQMIESHLQEHQLLEDRQLTLKKGDIVYLAQGIVKKVGLPAEDIKDFIGPNGFIIIPPKHYAESFITISEAQFISLSESDFIRIIDAHSYLLKPYQKLIMYWQRRRAVRAELLKQDNKTAKNLFPKYFKGIAHDISNRDKANYLSISYNYYSVL